MSLIVKTITRLVSSFITLFGIYIVLYGHVTPGGGFAGGVIIAAGFILLLLAFGQRQVLRFLSHALAVTWDCAGAFAFLAIALLGYLAGGFFVNFLGRGEPYTLSSAGTIPLLNMAVGAKVSAGLFGVFLALAAYRAAAHKEDEP